ncbi:MAG: hypothetical protein QG599_3308 [Pseudomonadota bacterium]|nr:hypothetical protein [Pseudomonadota bacterium]
MTQPLAPSAESSVAVLLADLGCNPFQEMATLAMDGETPIDLRVRLWMALAKYCAPQLRAVELKAPQLDLDLGLRGTRDIVRQELGLPPV